jgi:hypothetical protein
MPLLRQIIRAAATIGAPVVFAPVAGEWFVKLAEERGLYEQPSSRLERAMSWLASWTALPGFDLVAGLVLGLTVGVWVDYLLRLRERRRGVATSGSGALVANERGVYVAQVHVDTGRLTSDFLVEFAFSAFNATGAALRLADLRGHVVYAATTNSAESDWKTLPPPVLRDGSGATFAPLTEFMVIVSQRVPGDLAVDVRDGCGRPDCSFAD